MNKYVYKRAFYCKRLQSWKELWFFRYGVGRETGRVLLGLVVLWVWGLKVVVLVAVLDVSFKGDFGCVESG